MKLLTLPQPWATAAVCGYMPVINAKKDPGYTGPVVIHAAGVVHGDAAGIGCELPGFKVQHALIGVVSLDYACDPEGTDLPGAVGPSCWVISMRCVFDQPAHFHDRATGLRDAPLDLDWEKIIAAALKPRDWLDREWAKHVPVKPDDIHQPTADGWTGD